MATFSNKFMKALPILSLCSLGFATFAHADSGLIARGGEEEMRGGQNRYQQHQQGGYNRNNNNYSQGAKDAGFYRAGQNKGQEQGAIEGELYQQPTYVPAPYQQNPYAPNDTPNQNGTYYAP